MVFVSLLHFCLYSHKSNGEFKNGELQHICFEAKVGRGWTRFSVCHVFAFLWYVFFIFTVNGDTYLEVGVKSTLINYSYAMWFLKHMCLNPSVLPASACGRLGHLSLTWP